MSLFRVEGMNCGHCEKAIKEELTHGLKDIEIKFDLQGKTIEVDHLPEDRVIFLLKEMGYRPELIK